MECSMGCRGPPATPSCVCCEGEREQCRVTASSLSFSTLILSGSGCRMWVVHLFLLPFLFYKTENAYYRMFCKQTHTVKYVLKGLGCDTVPLLFAIFEGTQSLHILYNEMKLRFDIVVWWTAEAVLLMYEEEDLRMHQGFTVFLLGNKTKEVSSLR